jgi:hypothetical protein
LSRSFPPSTLEDGAVATASIMHGGYVQERYTATLMRDGRIVCDDRPAEARMSESTWSELRDVRPGRYDERDPRSWFAREEWVAEDDPVVWLLVSFDGEERRFESQAWGGPCPLIQVIAALTVCRRALDWSDRELCGDEQL